MLRLTNLRVPLDMASGSLRPLLEKKLSLHSEELLSWRLVRRSVDARDKSDVHFVCTIDIAVSDESRVRKRNRNLAMSERALEEIGRIAETLFCV